MFVSIGRGPEGEELLDLLGACHSRIRSFSSLALELSARSAHPAAERIEACERAIRYFREALPLHVRDEEESLLPRLIGRAPGLDEALATMRREHDEHGPLLDAVLERLDALRASPDDDSLRAALRPVATALQRAFEDHLLAEERVIFAAVAEHLDESARREVVGELRARRARSLRVSG